MTSEKGTVKRFRQRGTMRRFLVRFLVAAFFSLEAVWAGWVMLRASEGGLSIPAYLAYFYGGLLFALVLAAWSVSSLIVGATDQRRFGSAIRRPAVLAQATILIVVFVTVSLDAGFRVRLALSKAALRAVALGTVDGSRSEGTRRIGLFQVREVDAVGGAVRFITAGCGFDDCGVVYGPTGRPPRVGEDAYTDLGGGWWHWHRSW